MSRGLIVAVTVAAMAAAAVPSPAHARGEVAAGIIGGLAIGTILGAAAAQQRPYYAPAPVYAEPPVDCYWTRGEPVWDPYRGIWRRPRVQVCD
jgi:hypothetical protein